VRPSSSEVLGNAALGRIGFDAGVDKPIIANTGNVIQSNKMVATTIEAIIGAAFLDAGNDGLKVVRSIIKKLQMDNHPLLTVTFRDAPLFAFTTKQMITNMRPPSSLIWGTPESSATRTPGWSIYEGPDTLMAAQVKPTASAARLCCR
jgi:hypothetical protein